MATIIAGRFTEQAQVTRAIDGMADAGISPDRMSHFYLNPPGQHDVYPVGGDRNDSPGAHEAGGGIATGATTGGIVGAAVGLTGAPVFGPLGPAVGALVGAHVGGLVGSLTQMKEKGIPEDSTATAGGHENEEIQRHSGMMLAVAIDAANHQEVIRLMKAYGATDIEQTEGTIANGDWPDFDPLSPLHLVVPPTAPAKQ